MPTPMLMEFWEGEGALLWNALFEIYTESLADGMAGGVQILPTNVQALVDWDWLNERALELAKVYKYELIKGITDTTRQQTQHAISDWITSGEPLPHLERALESIYGSARASRIAVTETTRIYADGNMAAWESSGVVGSRRWMTARDDLVCPICSALDGEERGMDEPFGEGFLDAPVHVNCRCWLQPVVDEESVGRKLDEILGGH